MLVEILIGTLCVTVAALTAFAFAIRLPRGKSSGNFVKIPVGHRGCRFLDQIPENSLSSFKEAIRHGCTALELDCRLTKDGQVIVAHDDTLHRVCTVDEFEGQKYISDLTLEQIKKLRYKNWNSEEQLPTLAEVFDLCKANNVKLFVEMKCLTPREAKTLAKKVTDIFKQYQAWDFACMITFHPVAVYFVRMYEPKIECCILYSNNFYQHGVKNGTEKKYPFITAFAYILDVLLINSASTLVPFITGCSMIGPDISALSRTLIQHYQKVLNLDIYAWVANTSYEADFCLGHGCSVGTDFVFPQPVDVSRITDNTHRANMTKPQTILAQYPNVLQNKPNLTITNIVAQKAM